MQSKKLSLSSFNLYDFIDDLKNRRYDVLTLDDVSHLNEHNGLRRVLKVLDQDYKKNDWRAETQELRKRLVERYNQQAKPDNLQLNDHEEMKSMPLTGLQQRPPVTFNFSSALVSSYSNFDKNAKIPKSPAFTFTRPPTFAAQPQQQSQFRPTFTFQGQTQNYPSSGQFAQEPPQNAYAPPGSIYQTNFAPQTLVQPTTFEQQTETIYEAEIRQNLNYYMKMSLDGQSDSLFTLVTFQSLPQEIETQKDADQWIEHCYQKFVQTEELRQRLRDANLQFKAAVNKMDNVAPFEKSQLKRVYAVPTFGLKGFIDILEKVLLEQETIEKTTEYTKKQLNDQKEKLLMIKQKKLPLIVENFDKLALKAIFFVERQVRYRPVFMKCAKEIQNLFTDLRAVYFSIHDTNSSDTFEAEKNPTLREKIEKVIEWSGQLQQAHVISDIEINPDEAEILTRPFIDAIQKNFEILRTIVNATVALGAKWRALMIQTQTNDNQL